MLFRRRDKKVAGGFVKWQGTLVEKAVETPNSGTQQAMDNVCQESGAMVEEVWEMRKRSREEDALQTFVGRRGGYGPKMTEDSFDEHKQKYFDYEKRFQTDATIRSI
ncbi:unnamed protein product [Umbelopsis ramanniana]